MTPVVYKKTHSHINEVIKFRSEENLGIVTIKKSKNMKLGNYENWPRKNEKKIITS
jgi:hypothetical protein